MCKASEWSTLQPGHYTIYLGLGKRRWPCSGRTLSVELLFIKKRCSKRKSSSCLVSQAWKELFDCLLFWLKVKETLTSGLRKPLATAKLISWLPEGIKLGPGLPKSESATTESNLSVEFWILILNSKDLSHDTLFSDIFHKYPPRMFDVDFIVS